MKHDFEPDVEYEVYGHHSHTGKDYKVFKRIESFRYLWKDIYISSFDDFCNRDIQIEMPNYPYKTLLEEWKIKFPD